MKHKLRSSAKANEANMKNPGDEKTDDTYWKYLEENSKVVSTWPDWLKGNRPGTTLPKAEEPDEKN